MVSRTAILHEPEVARKLRPSKSSKIRASAEDKRNDLQDRLDDHYGENRELNFAILSHHESHLSRPVETGLMLFG